MFALILLVMVLAGQFSANGGCTKLDRVIDVGVVLDANSKMGKQMIAAIEVACCDYGSKYKLEVNPRYVNSDGDPGHALSLAEELIGRDEVQVMIWLDTWREDALLSDISRRSRIPIVSLVVGDGYPTLGMKHGNELKEFQRKFVKTFRRIHGAGDVSSSGPSVNALKAYDCITVVARAFDGITCQISTRKISEVKFMGFSGPINLEKLEGLRLWLPTSTNAIPKTSLGVQDRGADRRKETRVMLEAATKKFLIGVPRKTPFDIFVQEVEEKTGKIKYVGFCIDVFHAALRRAGLRVFDYDFVAHNGTYDELVEKVHNKTYSGAVGDITILANRSKVVEFTQPFMESSLSLIVLARHDQGKRFLFAKPFTPYMWAASGGVLLYTVFIVWALEHGHNREFSGSPAQQLSAAMWFTFSSLFFAHREHVHHSPTRIVLAMWFFVALILTQSYTASLTSMLTLQSINPSIPTIEWLRTHNADVGCDPETFVCDYLVNVLKFDMRNIRGITNTSSYGDHFQNKSIAALFLESPYEKAFFTHYCEGYISTLLPYRFGGFGFAFLKSSTLADTFSEAILELSMDGNLTSLQGNKFSSSCEGDGNNANTTMSIDTTPPSLGLNSFWVLYMVTIGTSTCCLVLSCLFFRRKHGYLRNESGDIFRIPTSSHNPSITT